HDHRDDPTRTPRRSLGAVRAGPRRGRWLGVIVCGALSAIDEHPGSASAADWLGAHGAQWPGRSPAWAALSVQQPAAPVSVSSAWSSITTGCPGRSPAWFAAVRLVKRSLLKPRRNRRPRIKGMDMTDRRRTTP